MANQLGASAPASQGIERAPLDAQPALKSNATNGQPHRKSKLSEDGAESSHQGRQSGLLASARRLSMNLRARIHKRSHDPPNIAADQRLSDKTTFVPTLAPNPLVATDQDRFNGQAPVKPGLPPIKEFLHSPVQTVKSVIHVEGGGGVVETLATKDVSHEAGVELVRANERLANARTESEEDLALESLEYLKAVRQDSYIRWTLDRHVRKVGRVESLSSIANKEIHVSQQGENSKQETDWKSYGHHVRSRFTSLHTSKHSNFPQPLLFHFYLEKYGGHYIGASDDLPEPTEAAFVSSFERILQTSTPVQDVFMTLRRVSHWEYPWESGAYMVIYFLLLIYSYITRAFLLFALYIVIRRRYYPPTISELRTDLELSEDKEEQAHDLSQLIDQHGTHGWVDPLIEQAGPVTLCHLEDLANFMEMLRNFYEWRDPTRTAITLGWLLSLWVMITLTPTSILVKESFLALGFMFFGLAPLSARYPRYRLLLAPWIWLFWRIPTHAEWAITRLRLEATRQLETMREQDSSTQTSRPARARAQQSVSSETEAKHAAATMRVGRYHCISENRHGNLCVSTEGVSFENHLTATERWRFKYTDMKSIEKAVGNSTLLSGDELVLTDMQGTQYVASRLKARDEVFTQIIGYSDVQWQRMM